QAHGYTAPTISPPPSSPRRCSASPWRSRRSGGRRPWRASSWAPPSHYTPTTSSPSFSSTTISSAAANCDSGTWPTTSSVMFLILPPPNDLYSF
ncbi:unnamed protein product, partial [Musa acuminata var. zebrina]